MFLFTVSNLKKNRGIIFWYVTNKVCEPYLDHIMIYSRLLIRINYNFFFQMHGSRICSRDCVLLRLLCHPSSSQWNNIRPFDIWQHTWATFHSSFFNECASYRRHHQSLDLMFVFVFVSLFCVECLNFLEWRWSFVFFHNKRIFLGFFFCFLNNI